MDLPVMDGGGTAPAYDYRLYDRIWQRVSPDLAPYPELRNGEGGQCPAAGGLAAPGREGGEAPGNGEEGCCLGEAALPSLGALEEFFAMELAESRCFRALASRVCRRDARDLLRRMADEKCRAARHLAAALLPADRPVPQRVHRRGAAALALPGPGPPVLLAPGVLQWAALPAGRGGVRGPVPGGAAGGFVPGSPTAGRRRFCPCWGT